MTSTIPTVGDYMTKAPHTVGAEQPLTEAERRMQAFGVRHLPVLRGGALVGVVSDRDVALVSSLPGVEAGSLSVADAMSQDPYQVPSNAPLDEVAKTMEKNRYGSAVVVDGGNVVGVFTTTDALRALADHILRCCT